MYVSATTCSSFTLSGPPSSLKSTLAELAKLPGVFSTELSLSAPYHAEHLPLPDIDAILGEHEAWDMAVSSQSRFMSSHSGVLVEGIETLRDLLRHALIDVFKRPLNVQVVAESLKLLARDGKLNLVTIGPCNVGRSFKEALAPIQIQHIGTGTFCELGTTSSGANPDAIAVIGMAGRFPGADSLEEFWSILEKGIDTCKKVRPLQDTLCQA